MEIYTVNPIGAKKKRFFSNLSPTYQLILINVFCFILFNLLFLFGFIGEDFVFISYEGIFENYYFWTFLTNMFMHVGIFHLFVNMLSLFFVGRLVERILGKKRFFWAYLLSGFFAGILHILFNGALAAGASGAIFGIIGVLIFLTPNLPVYVMFIPIPIKLKYAAPGILILIWGISLLAKLPVGNLAHLGGLLFGVIYGLYLKYKFPNKIKFIQKNFS